MSFHSLLIIISFAAPQAAAGVDGISCVDEQSLPTLEDLIIQSLSLINQNPQLICLPVSTAPGTKLLQNSAPLLGKALL